MFQVVFSIFFVKALMIIIFVQINVILKMDLYTYKMISRLELYTILNNLYNYTALHTIANYLLNNCKNLYIKVWYNFRMYSFYF